MRWLEPARVTLGRDPRGLTLRVDDETVAGLVPVTAFPQSAVDGPVALRTREGRTVGVIEQPSALDAASRAALTAVVAEQEFSPEVLEVLALDHSENTYVWSVVTSAGARTFRSRQSYHQLPVLRLASGAIEIAAEDGVRYRIRDVSALDAASRARLAPVL